MARIASCLLILVILAGCSSEADHKRWHEESCAFDRQRMDEYNECFKDAGCKHDAYDYRLRNNLKDRLANCVSN